MASSSSGELGTYGHCGGERALPSIESELKGIIDKKVEEASDDELELVERPHIDYIGLALMEDGCTCIVHRETLERKDIG